MSRSEDIKTNIKLFGVALLIALLFTLILSPFTVNARLNERVNNLETIINTHKMFNPSFVIQEFVIVKNIQKNPTNGPVKIKKILSDLREWYKGKYSTECICVSVELLVNYFDENNYAVECGNIFGGHTYCNIQDNVWVNNIKYGK